MSYKPLVSETKHIGEATDLAELQARLSELSPSEIIHFAYSPRCRPLREENQALSDIARNFPNRWQLIHHAYRLKPEKLSRAYANTNWQKEAIDSESKFLVAETLLQTMKRRHRTFTARRLNGYAFGPQKGLKTYTTRIIQKRGKRRVLHIPKKTLARVQKALLKHVLNPIQQDLPAHITGGRVSEGDDKQYGIFQNAASHVGQKFIASFDIKDFFPSVKVSAIIKTLASLGPMKGNLEELAWPGETFDDHEIHWTTDAAVFVARLATHKGRLPQGAPSSPAIANIVFSKYDQAIMNHLGDSFIYTRYFDDITISISDFEARKEGIRTANELKSRAVGVINEKLAGTPFKLNERKTRSTKGELGALVTGLRVSPDSVDVRRQIKRNTRALLHRIRSGDDGFVGAARHTYKQADFAGTRFNDQRQGHFTTDKRISIEKMAVIALPNICGEIKIEIPESTEAKLHRRIKKELELHEGKQALKDVGYLLKKIWQLQLSVSCDEGHVLFKEKLGKVVARLRCDRNDGFFLLDKKEAFAVIDLWYRLHGLWSGMNPMSPEKTFRKVHSFRTPIEETLSKISITRQGRHELEQPRIVRPPDDEIITVTDRPSGRIERIAGPTSKLLKDFQELTNPSSSLPRLRKFRAIARDTTELKEWVGEIRNVCQKAFNRFPNDEIWKLIRILDDRLNDKRNAFYSIEKKLVQDVKFHEKNRQKKPKGNSSKPINEAPYLGELKSLAPDIVTSVQANLLESIRDSLERSIRLYNSEGLNSWRKSTENNLDNRPLQQQIDSHYQQLLASLENALWKNTDQRIFLDPGIKQIGNVLDDCFRVPDQEQVNNLAAVFKFGYSLFGPTGELLDGDQNIVSEQARELLKKQKITDPGIQLELREELKLQLPKKAREVFDVANRMRNWHSHFDQKNKHEEWFKCLKYVAKKLERNFRLTLKEIQGRGETDFAYPSDLAITSLEAAEIMLIMCRDLTDGFKKLAANK